MQTNQHFSIAIKILLTTAAAVLLLNFFCARGAGVEILSFFNYVAAEDIEIKANIMRGVDLMQSVIKITVALGLFLSGSFFIKGLFKARNTKLLKS